MLEQTLSIDLGSSNSIIDLPASDRSDSVFDQIPDAIAALKAGQAIVVVDDEDQFQIYGYRNLLDGSEATAIVKGEPKQFADQPTLVRIHSECLTGDAFGSLRCDCRQQLQTALQMIEAAGQGVVVYLRQEGRGIGLINKLKAYSLQDQGFDTVIANEKLGFKPDLRTYGVGAQILKDLNLRNICLLTNNPQKVIGLNDWDLNIIARVPLVISANHYSTSYLTTKAEKLGHLLKAHSPNPPIRKELL